MLCELLLLLLPRAWRLQRVKGSREDYSRGTLAVHLDLPAEVIAAALERGMVQAVVDHNADHNILPLVYSNTVQSVFIFPLRVRSGLSPEPTVNGHYRAYLNHPMFICSSPATTSVPLVSISTYSLSSSCQSSLSGIGRFTSLAENSEILRTDE